MAVAVAVAVRFMVTPEQPGQVVLRLSITGRLGRMDYLAVLKALEGSYELLQRTARRVLGDRADGVHGNLTGPAEGSAVTLVRPGGVNVTERELRETVDTYVRDLAAPAERLPDDDVPVLREALQELQRTDSGALLASLQGPQNEGSGLVALVDPTVVLPQLLSARPRRQQVIGSVVGRLESLDVHGKREASLWNELDERRVVVTFGEAEHDRVHSALRKRVEVFGLVQEDADGRPLRVRLQELEVLALDEELPSLASLAGSMPDLTGGLTPEEYLDQRRRGLGLV